MGKKRVVAAANTFVRARASVASPRGVPVACPSTYPTVERLTRRHKTSKRGEMRSSWLARIGLCLKVVTKNEMMLFARYSAAGSSVGNSNMRGGKGLLEYVGFDVPNSLTLF